MGSFDAFGEIDGLLVPCLAVDAQGYRLGSGQGYYDITLAHAQSQPKSYLPRLSRLWL